MRYNDGADGGHVEILQSLPSHTHKRTHRHSAFISTEVVENKMSSYSRVIHHATSILCSHKGSMELSQLHRKVYQRFDISDEHFWYILKKCPRFAVVRNKLGAEKGEADYIVVAKTSLRLCKNYAKQDCFGCQDLHLCKYFVYGNCRYGKGR